jgi:Predicted site-specific integrase-resolvase
MKSTTKLAKKYGVTSQTIRNWIKAGKLEVKEKTQGGHFRIQKKLKGGYYMQELAQKNKSQVLKTKKLLQEKYPNAEVIIDVASAFNFERKGLKAILESAMSGSAICVVVTTQDRLARSGFGLIKWVIELHGGEIISLEEEISSETFDTKELIGFITSFCNSHYGKRSARRRKEIKHQKRLDFILKIKRLMTKL